MFDHIRDPELRAKLVATANVLQTMDDPGKAFDIIESWLTKYQGIPILFSEGYTPLNYLVGFGRRDFSALEKVFWAIIIPEMVDYALLSPKAKAKAARRRYQRGYMRKRRAEEKVRQAAPEADPAYMELEQLLAAMPDEDDTGLIPKE